MEQVFTDYQVMIDRAGLDAVAVVTPNLHHPMVMAALRAGLHVLCEEPMACSAAESEEMLAAAERAGAVLVPPKASSASSRRPSTLNVYRP